MACEILSLSTNREGEKSCAVPTMSRGTMRMRRPNARHGRSSLVVVNVLQRIVLHDADP